MKSTLTVPVSIRVIGPSVRLRREPTRRPWWQFWKPKFVLGESFEGTKVEVSGDSRPPGLYIGQMLIHEHGRMARIVNSYHNRLVIEADWRGLPPGNGFIVSFS